MVIQVGKSDASEAMGNWLQKPSQLMERCRSSDMPFCQKLAPLEPYVQKLGTGLMVTLTAPLDCYYHAFWFVAKSGLTLVPERVREATFGPILPCERVLHGEKCLRYFAALFWAPITACVNPDQVRDYYLRHNLMEGELPPREGTVRLEKVVPGTTVRLERETEDDRRRRSAAIVLQRTGVQPPAADEPRLHLRPI